MAQLVLSKTQRMYCQTLGITSYYQLLDHIPTRYDTFSDQQISPDLDGSVVCFKGEVTRVGEIKNLRENLTIFFFYLKKEHYSIKVSVFNRTFLINRLREHPVVVIKGKFDYYKKEVALSDINFYEDIIGKVIPQYSLPKTLYDKTFSKLVEKVFNYMSDNGLLSDIIPLAIRQKYKLISRSEAYKNIHFPVNSESVFHALRYLKYEELLRFSLMINLDNSFLRSHKKKEYLKCDTKIINHIINTLPYSLTGDQIKAINQIVGDLNHKSLMYRLLQGDVGTGKTIVAFLTMIGVAQVGYQSVLMVPTDVLARQHYANLQKLTNMEVVLLVASLTSKEKKLALDKLKTGQANLIIGTHALIQDKVEYANLGYVVIDEQHRFGVNQRQNLKLKGESVDLLAMSATPIPRTLAISIYGEMDISILRQFPNLERKVITKVLVTNTIKGLLNEIFIQVKRGKKIYIICSAIDNQEKRNVSDVYAGLQDYLGESLRIDLLHGRLDDLEKLEVLNRFYRGETDVLVSTTVVEVGVDVKEATMMIIYDAERFGLSQLHQLRGRIGRAGDTAYCYLLTSKSDSQTLDRLRFLQTCNDGFELAQYDLKMRGPGELIGVKQAGVLNFKFSSFENDLKILEYAQSDAKNIILDIDNPIYADLLEKVREEKDRWQN